MAGVRDRRGSGGVVVRGLLAAVFVAAAGMKFAAAPFEVSGSARLGDPTWLTDAVGALQFVGAILLWTRGHVAHGTLLLTALVIGAVASHLRVGDPVAMAIPAASLLIVLAGSTEARRAELPGRGPRGDRQRG